MYADRVEAEAKSSIKDRLNGGALEISGRRRQVTGKRQRQDDDRWEHDLYEHTSPLVTKRRFGAQDLRLKLQKKSILQTQSAKGPSSGGVRDLREKLSGITYAQPVETFQPKPKPAVDVSRPVRKSVVIENPLPDTKKVASSVSKKRTQQKVEKVDNFLQTLGLEKYSITFQAEEVDMTALLHMSDEDLKAIGIPMGPRKKILLALESKA